MAGKSNNQLIHGHQSGFTLVEALVAGLVAVIVAGVVFVIYVMYDTELRETAVLGKLQRQYDNVTDQISLDVRRSAHVLKYAGESYPAVPDTVDTVFLADTNGVDVGRYLLGGDTLFEWTGGSWQPFTSGGLGGGVVEVDGASSGFILNALRDQVGVRVRIKTTDRDSTYYLDPRKDAFKCRN